MKTILCTIILVAGMARFSFGANIKEPNVSGQFYDANAQKLAGQIDFFLQAARAEPSAKRVEMIIAPHAGYFYSGAVAAHSFKAASRGKYRTIIILAPSHHYPFDNISVWPEGGFKTPLGTVNVDQEFARGLMALNPKFTFDPQVFEKEHSLEVEIPFLQKTFQDFKIVPIIMGQPSLEFCRQVAQALDQMIGQRQDVLVVVSTDLSHYHHYDFAKDMDHRTIEAVVKLEVEKVFTQCQLRTMEMCGCVPVTTAMLLAKERGLTDIQILRYANSGDVTGEKDRVVGYSSVAFYARDTLVPEPAVEDAAIKPLTKAHKKKLLDIAQQTIETFIKTGKRMEVKESDPRLQEYEGAFVTLHKAGQLRGCIGHIIGDQPLSLTVRDMAIAAATEDPRFEALTEAELKDIDIEVSVLSRPRQVKSYEEVIAGTHGVIISRGGRRGLFLPQVATEWNWGREEFLSNLCTHKAGLPADCWKDPRTQIEVFTATVFDYKGVKE